MPIQRITPQADIDRFIAERIEALNNALVYRMCAIGEQVLNAARSTNSYKDQTGNLRSSIGYAVSMDGNIVQMSSFETVKNGETGSDTGKNYVMQLIKGFPQGIVLIVVAGMNYATYVSAKGYDVLDSSELLAEKLVPQMLKKLGLK